MYGLSICVNWRQEETYIIYMSSSCDQFQTNYIIYMTQDHVLTIFLRIYDDQKIR